MSRIENNHVTKVAIVGAGGRVGGPFARSLLETGKHTVTAITREDSTSGAKLPEGVHVVKVNYDNEESVVSALKGQEVLIITLSVQTPKDTQAKLISAAAKAGVPYLFHNAYGGDITAEQVNKDTGLAEAEAATRKQIEDLGVSKWIAFCCGFWYEWSLPMGTDLYGFDIKNREVIFFDDGETKFSTSTWPQCGRGMAALLSLPVEGQGTTLESFANKPVYIQSFRVSQKDMLASILRVTGDKESDWKVEYQPAQERWEEGRAAMMKGDRQGFARMLYARSMAKDTSGNFEGKLNNDVLGLKDEDLDEWTKFCVDFAMAGRSWWAE
ncbi:MAG: hypothetical protein GOMPHAMPRED_002388 [Gomphillus americanus]|uniref:NmrA-like domain-containing protein n=1 Tax=Gomphillus americanus TaxID=1940652 RepID=A0A8H3II54_9LECA|nr:MAG: hypothetical protein GOMPHAMPRED_002388 [Gomphillus americanus]